MSNIQIRQELFIDLLWYFGDLDESEEEKKQRFNRCRKALEEKFDKVLARQYYTQYKTDTTEEQREEARQKYLDHKGIQKKFRW